LHWQLLRVSVAAGAAAIGAVHPDPAVDHLELGADRVLRPLKLTGLNNSTSSSLPSPGMGNNLRDI